LRRAFPIKDYWVSTVYEAGNRNLKPFGGKHKPLGVKALREANKNIVLFRTNNKQGQSNYTLLNGTTQINGSIKICMQSENNYDSQRKRSTLVVRETEMKTRAFLAPEGSSDKQTSRTMLHWWTYDSQRKETVVSTLVRKRFSTLVVRETEMKTRAFLAPEGSSGNQTSRTMLHWWTMLKLVPAIDTSIEADSSKGPIRGVTKRKISLALQGLKICLAFVRVSNDIVSHTHEVTDGVNKSKAADTRSSTRKKKAQAFTKSNDNSSHTHYFTLSLPFSHTYFASSNLEVL